MKKTKSGIYIIENKVNGKKYIGQSVNIQSRRSKHFGELKRGTHHNGYLQNSYDKYGEENFVHYVVEYCDIDMLDEREMHYILFFDTTNEQLGYNLDSGGNLNRKVSEITKEKQRMSSLGTNSKLTVKDVEEIKKLLLTNLKQKEIADRFGVKLSTINKIAKCKNWTWVCPELNDKIIKAHSSKVRKKEEIALELLNNNVPLKTIEKQIGISYQKLLKLKGFRESDFLEERNKKIVNDFNLGMTKKEIMDKYNITSAVYVSATSEAFNKKMKKMKQQAIDLRNYGFMVSEIADIYKIHRTTVTEWTKNICKNVRKSRHVNTEVNG